MALSSTGAGEGLATVGERHSSNLWTRTEVEYQSGFKGGASQVVEYLRAVGLVDPSRRLELDGDGSFHHEVQPEQSNRVPAKQRVDLDFGFHLKGGLAQCDSRGRTVHGLQKSVSQLIIDIEEDPNDAGSDVQVLETGFSVSYTFIFTI